MDLKQPTKNYAKLCWIIFDWRQPLKVSNSQWQNVFLQRWIDVTLWQPVVKRSCKHVEFRAFGACCKRSKWGRYWLDLSPYVAEAASKYVPIPYAQDRFIGISNDTTWKLVLQLHSNLTETKMSSTLELENSKWVLDKLSEFKYSMDKRNIYSLKNWSKTARQQSVVLEKYAKWVPVKIESFMIGRVEAYDVKTGEVTSPDHSISPYNFNQRSLLAVSPHLSRLSASRQLALPGSSKFPIFFVVLHLFQCILSRRLLSQPFVSGRLLKMTIVSCQLVLQAIMSHHLSDSTAILIAKIPANSVIYIALRPSSPVAPCNRPFSVEKNSSRIRSICILVLRLIRRAF